MLRTVVGDVIPLKKDDDVPEQYRQTLPAPLAPPVSEAEVPLITESLPIPSSD